MLCVVHVTVTLLQSRIPLFRGPKTNIFSICHVVPFITRHATTLNKGQQKIVLQRKYIDVFHTKETSYIHSFPSFQVCA